MTSNQHFLTKQGDQYRDFTVLKYLPIPELNCILREIEHVPSGAHVMHIDCEDPENLFCLSFKTYPSSSDGAAHILEHTVLCGSQKFPVKDPFFAMTRRSLNTFMNALTGSDFTCYPAASQNEKDFYNLLDVYIDAVFHPELKKMSFLQEGHRLEFTDPQDPKTPLQIKGIVFNEMKGSLSSLESRLWHALMEHLVPDLPYSHNSGGDPKVIPQLSYEELLKFHATYYHPSQCLFFFYGNFSLKNHLDVLAATALKGVNKQPPLPSIHLQKRFKAPLQKEVYYPINTSEDTEPRSAVVFGFLTTPLINQEDVIALCVLDAILMDNDASLLKAELLSSKLCVHVDAYMDTDMSEIPYALVFKGCDPDQADAIEKDLKERLNHIVKTGIPREAIEAAIHQLEFSKLEIAADHSPFGLTLFMRSALPKQHGCSAENALMIHSLFEELLIKVRDPHYLTGLIKKYLIDNTHQVRLVMRPDEELCAKETEQEVEMLKQVHAKLTKEESQKILKETQELLAFQKQTEEQSLDCLPKVTLKDVSPHIRTFQIETIKDSAVTLYHHDCFTNHITYADLFFDLPHIEQSDLCYLPLLLSLIPELGCGNRTYSQNLNYMQSHIGSIDLSCGLYTQIINPELARPAIHIKGKALDRNAPYLFTLMQEMIKTPRFDEKKRIEELLKKLRDSQLNQLSRRAMRYASSLSLSSFSSASYVSECWHGLTYFKMIETLTHDLSKNLSPLIDKLIDLKDKLFTFHNPHLVLCCSNEMKEKVLKSGCFGINSLSSTAPFIPATLKYDLPSVPSQGRSISSQVAFTVEAFKTSTYLAPHSAALTIASALMDNLILHRQIREQGGAYGCGATYSATLGHFCFHAYRDPHLVSTLRTFHRSIDEIASGHFKAPDLEEAKLGLIQQLDTPISPSGRALIAYNWIREGKTEQMRQTFRDHLLNLTPSDIQQALATELLLQKEKGVVVSFAGKALLDKENKKLSLEGKPLTILPI